MKSERGASLVEATIALPLILFLGFGSINFLENIHNMALMQDSLRRASISVMRRGALTPDPNLSQCTLLSNRIRASLAADSIGDVQIAIEVTDQTRSLVKVVVSKPGQSWLSQKVSSTVVLPDIECAELTETNEETFI